MQPKLAITMGDPAGIGPEIIVKSLNKKENYEKCRPLVCGDAKVMQLAVDKMGTTQKINPIMAVSEAKFEFGTIDVYDLDLVNMTEFEFGQVQVQCGNAAFQSVKKAIELAMANELDGTVTSPLNK